MEQNEVEIYLITKPCAVCGIIKPLADFLLSILHLSSISSIKKYSEVCTQCRGASIQIEEQIIIKKESEKKINNQNKIFKKTKFNQKANDDDDSSGGGKGKRLTSDNYAKLSVIFKRDMSARVDTSMRGIDEGFKASTRPGSGRR